MRKVTVLVLVLTLVVTVVLAGQALRDWEWTRAVWMTVAFVAVEVERWSACCSSAASTTSRPGSSRTVASVSTPAWSRLAHRRGDHFVWLREEMGRTHVFVTMVVAGGVILSGVLWVIDQIARLTVTPTARASPRPGPAGDRPAPGRAGASGGSAPGRGPSDGRARRPVDAAHGASRTAAVSATEVHPWLVPLLAGVVLAVGAGFTVQWAVDETLTRHAPVDPGSHLVVVVRAERHDAAEHGEADLVEAVMDLCQLEVGGSVEEGDALALGESRYRFVLRPSLDEADQRQLRGCVEDLRIDHFLATVEEMAHGTG